MRGLLFAGDGREGAGCTVAGDVGACNAREASAVLRVTVTITDAMSQGKTAPAVRHSILQG